MHKQPSPCPGLAEGTTQRPKRLAQGAELGLWKGLVHPIRLLPGKSKPGIRYTNQPGASSGNRDSPVWARVPKARKSNRKEAVGVFGR